MVPAVLLEVAGGRGGGDQTGERGRACPDCTVRSEGWTAAQTGFTYTRNNSFVYSTGQKQIYYIMQQNIFGKI